MQLLLYYELIPSWNTCMLIYTLFEGKEVRFKICSCNINIFLI
uniref:Uncharacterized protein n=1 Tax=Arundo donax TaxID=35708 RepID=A0A0A8YQ05_ARUDO